MAIRLISVLLLLAVVSSTAAQPWELGDTFATTTGRLNVIDSKTLVSRLVHAGRSARACNQQRVEWGTVLCHHSQLHVLQYCSPTDSTGQ
jgi:hypothetical protein